MRRLGAEGPLVPSIGLGCGPMSGGTPDPARDNGSMATIRAAIDTGITLIDTADFYGNGHNEWLIRQALRTVDRDDPLEVDLAGSQVSVQVAQEAHSSRAKPGRSQDADHWPAPR